MTHEGGRWLVFDVRTVRCMPDGGVDDAGMSGTRFT
jgi:hypothetical protein